METSTKIRMIMRERGIGVKELAKMIGTSSSNLSNQAFPEQLQGNGFAQHCRCPEL